MKIFRFVNSFHKGRGISRYACQKASFTVEAAVVLPFFVCFLVFVLYFFRILQVQAEVAQSLQYTSRKIAAECCVQNETGKKTLTGETVSHDDESLDLGSMVRAGLLFRQQLKKRSCPVQYVQGGMAGISLLQSSFSENYVELKAVYRMKLPVGLLGNIRYQIIQESKCRKWTGYQPGQDTEDDDTWLFYTEYGTVYHASRTCTHLDLSISGIPYGQIGQNRNNSGGKYYKCEKCGSGSSGSGMVYITNYGDRYHTSLTCSGLKRSIYMIRRSKATEKRMCSKCGG